MKLYRHAFRAMNCHMAAWVYSDDPEAEAALKNIETWMAQVEQALSRFRADSDLSRLNASAGRPYLAGDILWEVTSLALEAAAATGGVFDPTIGQALIDAGYDRSFEMLAPVETKCETITPVHEARRGQESNSWASAGLSLPARLSQIKLDPASRAITLPPNTRLDLGGIAKGWAADCALDMLRPFGPAMIDAGGDLAIGDPPPGSQGWLVGAADPLRPDADLVLLRLANAGVATSGTDHRRWRHGGRQQHHLVDPRRNKPAQTDVLSATAIAPSATEADIIALALVVLGAQEAQQWLQRHRHIPALMVLNDGRSYQTSTFIPYVEASFPIYN